ncbi:putative ABC transporter ATP-binding protein/MT1014 [Roseivivax jejudonensis]|uniref:Putative ABC transporter ATP-binding protein/MT1014 n=1 Tax=Roseivivax jejudonensis TaxID=1529041 RepID=A0A1X6Z5T9_9RHOB|nr:ABC transporter ATP-binding protein [Roseivivax jejudonensis]SLN41443.1 putative ABC transporter ATP-binding protein/MT1014 [Roseivivax jejudonensis]
MLAARDLRKTYQTGDGPLTVLDGVSLSLDAGESVALTGESGSGKSTLLHCIGCLDTPDAGTLMLNGTALHDLDEGGRAEIRRRHIGVVFQSLNLIPSLTVARNLSFQARLADREDPDWTRHLTDRLGLSGLGERYPEQLSGGQQQRVAIGRAIAARPDLVLADEPTGNLDEDTADAVLSLLLDLVAETGAGFLMVTHSQRHAARLGRQLTLSAGRLA